MTQILVTKQLKEVTIGIWVPAEAYQQAAQEENLKQSVKQVAYYDKSLKALEVGERTGNWKFWEIVNGVTI